MGRGRPPLDLESWGWVQRLVHYGSPAALVYFRDADGKRRRMIRTGRMYAEPERNLTRALKERLTPTYELLTRESALGELARQWIEEIKREEKAIATISRYSSTIRSHVDPSAELRLYECTVPRLQRLEAAEDIEAASEQLGHSSSRITSRFYVPVKIDRSDFSSRLDAFGGGAQAS